MIKRKLLKKINNNFKRKGLKNMIKKIMIKKIENNFKKCGLAWWDYADIIDLLQLESIKTVKQYLKDNKKLYHDYLINRGVLYE